MMFRLHPPALAGRLCPALLLAAAAGLAACAGPVSSPFSQPEVRVEPPPAVAQPLGVSGPSATQF
jgi:hypothetical protein